MDLAAFLVAGAIVAFGALGVVLQGNPVRCALSLVATLFGIAVLFIQLDAPFLAAVQVIVYAGAIVILFLFVIMLLGVDRAENLGVEPLKGQRALALLVGATLIAGAFTVFLSLDGALSGTPERTAAVFRQVETGASPERVADAEAAEGELNTQRLGELLFTRYALAFEITGVLLTIAVVGAVVFARKVRGELEPAPPSALDERLAAAPPEGARA